MTGAMLIAACILLGLNLTVCFHLLLLRRCLQQLADSSPSVKHPPAQQQAVADPKTAVILCVRGADPSLAACLDGLTSQSHRNFTVHAVVDHASDPACPLLWQMAQSDPRIQIHQITDTPPKHRGLKVTAILHAVSQLPETVQQVAFIDADVIAHPDWLRQITGPLANPEIGACTGTRWFVPDQRSLGSLVRKEWNFYATAFMVRHQILWGGSFSMRACELKSAVEQGLWEHKLCEDTCLGDFFRNRGRRTVLVPAVAMINPECCGLAGAAAFIRRQQVFTWLYSSAARRIIGFAAIFTALCLISPVFAAVVILTGSPAAACVSLAACLLLQVAVVHLEWFGHGMAARLRTAAASAAPQPSTPLWRLYLAQLLCAAISLAACLQAVLTTRLSWRGIDYQISHRPLRVQMLKYQPFSATQSREQLPAGTGPMSI